MSTPAKRARIQPAYITRISPMYTKHTLSNGLRVILSPQHDTKSVTLLVLYGVGSRYEKKRVNGISHVVEHMMFKGTPKRPNTLAISKELDAVGAEYNAFTGKDYTGYYIKIEASHLPMAMDMLSDMLLNSKYDAKELEREKKVICEEIHMYKDNPLMHIDTLLEMELFKGSSLGWDIAGDDASVTGMSREDLVAYRGQFYVPDNACVGLAGNYDPEILTAVEKHFGEAVWKKGGKVTPFKKHVYDVQKKPKVVVEFKDSEQVQCALGFPAYEYTHKDAPALTLLATILGGTMSSRLFIQVRERLGLAYTIRASVQNYQDTGMVMIQSGLDKTRIQKAITVILKELETMKEKGVTEGELSRAKDHLKGKLALRLEDSEAVVSWYLNQEILTDETLTPEQKMDTIYAVTSADIKRVAKDVFKKSKMTVAVIGPFKDKSVIEKMVK